MKYQEIVDTYKKMGIGTQEERNSFLNWSREEESQRDSFVFIIESPNSDTVKEDKDAQLAPNSK